MYIGDFTNLKHFMPYFLDLNESYFIDLISGYHSLKMKPLYLVCLYQDSDLETRLLVI